MEGVTVDFVGRSGGLVSIWNPDFFRVDSISKDDRFLLLSGHISGVSERVFVLNLHAPNEPVRRRSLWEMISGLILQHSGMWFLLGDFNDVRSEAERINSRFDKGSTDAFNAFITNAGLLEFAMNGGKYTYFSGHSEVKMSKLDRFLVNDVVLSYWPNARVEVLKKGCSDHCPISLSCAVTDFGPIPFKCLLRVGEITI